MNADTLHRLTKALIDSGEAPTIEDASHLMSSYGVHVDITAGPLTKADEIIFLTVINVACRSFLGNVIVSAPPGLTFTVPFFHGKCLDDVLRHFGIATPSHRTDSPWPTITIGPPSVYAGQISPWADGWRFGIGARPESDLVFPPACVAAGALAVSEAFSILRGDNPYSGQRELSLSLWSLNKDEQGPPVDIGIPSCWLVGLGHLGQAYAWTLGFMRFSAGTTLYLQDIDTVTESTLSTSVLSFGQQIGERKTRVVARWLETVGLHTAIVERRFDGNQRIGPTEPRLALFGVDNAATRRVLEGAGYSRVIDAGLGSGYRDFRSIRLHLFPGPSSAARLWASADEQSPKQDAPAYEFLRRAGADPCGVTILASRAVGAPFVGCYASAYVVAEMLRPLLGGRSFEYVDLNLRDPQRMDAAA